MLGRNLAEDIYTRADGIEKEGKNKTEDKSDIDWGSDDNWAGRDCAIRIWDNNASTKGTIMKGHSATSLGSDMTHPTNSLPPMCFTCILLISWTLKSIFSTIFCSF